MRELADSSIGSKSTVADDGIRESEARLRSVLESAPNMIMTADRAGTILFINRVVQPNTLDQVIGTSIYDYVPPHDVARVRERIEHVLSTGEVTAYEVRSPATYGSRTFSVHAGPVRSHDVIVGVTLVTWDVTERVELQARLMA
ncbi:MAG: PAS domain S-box protein, partial [Polyangiaceae bacterium]